METSACAVTFIVMWFKSHTDASVLTGEVATGVNCQQVKGLHLVTDMKKY